jgi:hypothetical protein
MIKFSEEELLGNGIDYVNLGLVKLKELISNIELNINSYDIETKKNAIWFGINILHRINELFEDIEYDRRT